MAQLEVCLHQNQYHGTPGNGRNDLFNCIKQFMTEHARLWSVLLCVAAELQRTHVSNYNRTCQIVWCIVVRDCWAPTTRRINSKIRCCCYQSKDSTTRLPSHIISVRPMPFGIFTTKTLTVRWFANNTPSFIYFHLSSFVFCGLCLSSRRSLIVPRCRCRPHKQSFCVDNLMHTKHNSK